MSTTARQGSRLAGNALLTAAVLFVGVFLFLAARFDYPAILDRPADEVLPRLRESGSLVRGVWMLYAAIPLLLLPAGVGLAARHAAQGPLLASTVRQLFFFAACCMTVGLVRWPTLHWALAAAWPTADVATQHALAAMFDGANLMLGRAIGEFAGEMALNLGFVLAGVLEHRRQPWLGRVAIAAGLLGMVGAWRVLTSVVQPVADLENAVLPLWLVLYGVVLLRRTD